MTIDIRSAREAITIFKILGIKEVTTNRQRGNGTNVYQLPLKKIQSNLQEGSIKFATYKSGYVRNVSEGVATAYQINKTKKRPAGADGYHFETKERILIPSWEDRLIYLANFILKNYYQKTTYLVEDYTKKVMQSQYQQALYLRNGVDKLPF